MYSHKNKGGDMGRRPQDWGQLSGVCKDPRPGPPPRGAPPELKMAALATLLHTTVRQGGKIFPRVFPHICWQN